MSDDPKVISLDEHRHGTPRVRRGRGSAGAPSAPAAGAAQEGATQPAPGRLIWLYCPTCRTIEYTEQELPGGRTHNVCGTQVQEAPVELDLRAESTIARINLERLTILEQLLGGQRQRYEEYQRRIALAAGRTLELYPMTEDAVGALPVADVDAFGLLVSRFFHNPASHFPGLSTDSTANVPPAGGADE